MVSVLSMECFFSLLVLIAVIIQSVNSQSDANFVSIDCGFDGDPYVDIKTNLTFTSDYGYVDTGINQVISSDYQNASLSKQSLTVRSFPNGSRNCYRLPATQNGKYLVRASFMHAEYDKGMAMPMFGLHLGIDSWVNVSIENAYTKYDFEAITIALTDIISVCLINMNQGTPFISSLEMRLLKPWFYPIVYSNQTLALSVRYNMGPTDHKIIRYPDDGYDRIWTPYNYSWAKWNETSANIDLLDYYGDDPFHVPSSVLRTAVEPIGHRSISFRQGPSNNPEYYLILHFCELSSKERKIDINFNRRVMSNDSIVVHYKTAASVYSTKPITVMDFNNWSISTSADSDYLPRLNAFEMYCPVPISQTFTDPSDVAVMNEIKQAYSITFAGMNWQGDPCAPSGYNWDRVNCTSVNNTLRITTIDLSSSKLNGMLLKNFSILTELKYLNLSYNSLDGPIPYSLGDLKSLKYLDLSGNCFSGSMPDNLLKNADNELTLRYKDYNACKHSWKVVLIIVISCILGAAFLVGVPVFLIWRKTKKHPDVTIENVSNYAQEVPSWPLTKGSMQETTNYDDHVIQLPEICKFTYKELEKITDNFVQFIGRGGFGPVYHGYLEDKKEAAVKVHAHTSSHGMKEFLAEVGFLAKIHHRNLVQLVGYCREENHLGLVYEYMSQGCLNDHLRGQDAKTRSLKWRERLQIALDAAQGLDYLHTGSDAPIIHRDVKSSNILLDHNLRAKIADFGLSRAFDHNQQTHMSTMPAGTPGYIDIEYYNSGRLTEKSDVFSFGVVLLELVTGEPPMDPGKGHIRKWVLEMVMQGDIDNIADSKLQGDYEINSIWKIVDIAINCTANLPELRPTMNEVVIQIKESLALEMTRDIETGSSDSYSIKANGPWSARFDPTAR